MNDVDPRLWAAQLGDPTWLRPNRAALDRELRFDLRRSRFDAQPGGVTLEYGGQG